MNELTNNKTKTEDSRIFSTTEKTKVEVEGYMNPSEAWECMEWQVKYAYKVEDGLLDVIDRLLTEQNYLKDEINYIAHSLKLYSGPKLVKHLQKVISKDEDK